MTVRGHLDEGELCILGGSARVNIGLDGKQSKVVLGQSLQRIPDQDLTCCCWEVQLNQELGSMNARTAVLQKAK